MWDIEKDEDVAYQALKMIGIIDRPLSWPIAEKALKSGVSGERAKSAMYELSKKYVMSKAAREEKDWFIEACLNQRAKSEGPLSEKEQKMDNTVALALCDMRDEKALKVVVEDKRFSDWCKCINVDMDYLILLEALDKPDKATLAWVIEAMNIYPVEPVYRKLEGILKSIGSTEGLPKLKQPTELIPAFEYYIEMIQEERSWQTKGK